MLGKGKVYGNALGHAFTVWDNPANQKIYLEAMKWHLA
jgi:type 1 glutamine amidotransferase